MPIVAGGTALDHFVPPLVVRHDEGSEQPQPKQNAPNATTMRTDRSSWLMVRHPPEIDMTQLLLSAVLHDKAGVQFFDGPRRWESAGGIGGDFLIP